MRLSCRLLECDAVIVVVACEEGQAQQLGRQLAATRACDKTVTTIDETTTNEILSIIFYDLEIGASHFTCAVVLDRSTN